MIPHEYKDPYLVHGETNTPHPILLNSFLWVDNYTWEYESHQLWKFKLELQYLHDCQLKGNYWLIIWHGNKIFPFNPGGGSCTS